MPANATTRTFFDGSRFSRPICISAILPPPQRLALLVREQRFMLSKSILPGRAHSQESSADKFCCYNEDYDRFEGFPRLQQPNP